MHTHSPNTLLLVVLSFELHGFHGNLSKHTPNGLSNDIRKTQALATWEKLFSQPEIRMDAEQQYEALLHLADEFEDQGFISPQERGRLIEKATALYARSIEGIGEGT